VGEDRAEDEANAPTSGSTATGDGPTGSGEVVLVTHDSFGLPKKLVKQFEQETGYTLVHSPAGDGGELTNKLVLTQGDPLGDVAFGVDNTYASRALDEGVFAPYEPELPEGADDELLPGDDEGALTPVDHASVCVNVDDAWFAEHDMEPPATFEDLAEPEYEGLFVTPAATSSTPGMAFMLATIGHFGDDWLDYWEDLLANDAKIVKGWEDAYYVDFTFSGGDRPIVLSYDSSPAFTVPEDGGDSTTSALLDTCFEQVEYAGVLEGAANPEGARAVIDWLLSPEVQAALPTSMYVFPVDDGAELPREWAAHAVQPEEPVEVDPAEIAGQRQEWLQLWTDVTTR
jgi:thiamine transport system substrate-binding protein